MINTAKATDRRPLRFETIDQMLADIDLIASSDRAGTLTRSGNWTAGQAFSHIAAFINYAYDGYPPQLRAPWIIKALIKPFKNRFLNRAIPPGRKIPGIAGGTLGAEMLSTDEGARRLSAALDRLRKSAPAQPNVIFGPMTHEEWIKLHLRHGELHLSFQHP